MTNNKADLSPVTRRAYQSNYRANVRNLMVERGAESLGKLDAYRMADGTWYFVDAEDFTLYEGRADRSWDTVVPRTAGYAPNTVAVETVNTHTRDAHRRAQRRLGVDGPF